MSFQSNEVCASVRMASLANLPSGHSLDGSHLLQCKESSEADTFKTYKNRERLQKDAFLPPCRLADGKLNVKFSHSFGV